MTFSGSEGYCRIMERRSIALGVEEADSWTAVIVRVHDRVSGLSSTLRRAPGLSSKAAGHPSQPDGLFPRSICLWLKSV